jgi:hypothetical protein
MRIGPLSDAMKLGIHGAGTHWNRGFMAFQLAWGRSSWPVGATLVTAMGWDRTGTRKKRTGTRKNGRVRAGPDAVRG